MNKTSVFVLTFLGSGIALFLIFYFYPAEIFDVLFKSALSDSADEIHLKAFLGMDDAFNKKLDLGNIQMKRKLSGWLILIILTIGLPLMLAYRVAFTKKRSATPENANDETL